MNRRTSELSQDLNGMKALVEDMHLVVMEKDAEIVRLKMQLADELRRTN